MTVPLPLGVALSIEGRRLMLIDMLAIVDICNFNNITLMHILDAINLADRVLSANEPVDITNDGERDILMFAALNYAASMCISLKCCKYCNEKFDMAFIQEAYDVIGKYVDNDNRHMYTTYRQIRRTRIFPRGSGIIEKLQQYLAVLCIKMHLQMYLRSTLFTRFNQTYTTSSVLKHRTQSRRRESTQRFIEYGALQIDINFFIEVWYVIIPYKSTENLTCCHNFAISFIERPPWTYNKVIFVN